jgi:hypothetical protein
LLLKSNILLLSLLDNSTLFNAIALALTKKLAFNLKITNLLIYYKIIILLFKLCQITHPDNPFTLAKEGNSDFFLQIAIILYLK